MTNEDYIEKNWAKMSPKFREAHNHLRRARGMSSIPEPLVDLYVPPRGPTAKPFDFSNPEFVGSARQFLGGKLMAPGEEGFTINGKAMR